MAIRLRNLALGLLTLVIALRVFTPELDAALPGLVIIAAILAIACAMLTPPRR